MLKAVAPVLFALAALATPAAAGPSLDVTADLSACHRFYLSSTPVAPQQIVTICPNP